MDSQVFNLLVLDANQRSALAVTRSLGHIENFQVTTADSVPEALAGYSCGSQKYLQYPDPSSQPDSFLNWITQQLASERYDLVLPTTEVTSQLLLQNQSNQPNLVLPFSPYATVMQLANKVALVKLAKKLDVPIPKSQVFSQAGQVAVNEIVFPTVLKPALSRIYTGKQWLHTRVRVLHSIADWSTALAEDDYLHCSPFMLQEFIPGSGAGIFCLFNRGAPVQYFAHQRLREKPPEGGVSVLSQSVAVDPELKRYAERLLKAVEWHGVAMIEFRVTPEGKPYLMEVNTRFWGSLQLAIDSGVDFPALLVQAQLGLPLQANEQYRVGQRLRWWLGDLDSLYIFLKRQHRWRAKLRRVAGFCAVRVSAQRHEVNRLNDLRPSWFELKQYIRALRGKA